MGQPVVHFEIIGSDPARLRSFYGELFSWEFDTSGRVADAVSEPTDYGFIDPAAAGNDAGIPGGIGGGEGYDRHTVFYVGVPDVERALHRAEQLGGRRVMGPESAPNGLVVAHFTDPEGNLIGLAGAN